VAYLLGTFSLLAILPKEGIRDLSGIIDAIAKAAGGLGWIVPLVALLICVSNLGAAGAYLGATARLPFIAGLDKYLPEPFGRLHPRYRTPHVAILTQTGCSLLFIFLSQAGVSVKGAYDLLISMGVITYFVPYLFVFAALIKVQFRGAGTIPGGAPVAIGLGVMGFAVTAFAMFLSFLPPAEEPNKVFAVAKIIGLTGILLGSGGLLFWKEKRRKLRELA
jgi:amino acid transporter